MKNILAFLFYSFLAVPSLAQTAAILPQGQTQYLDQNGNPLTGGKVYNYIVGTTTLKNTWSDPGETTLNTNPVILDAAGRAKILGQGTYRQIVKKSNGDTVWDAVTASTGSGGSSISTGDGDLVGTIKPWAGIVAPSQYAFAYGQEVSRTTYSSLLTAITQTIANVVCTSASSTLTGLPDTTQINIGGAVEISCMPAGTIVSSKTSSTVTVNNPATISTTVTGVFFPFGNGDGSTTFNLPDLRGRAVAGRNNMGGVASTNLTTTYFGSNDPNAQGATGGSQSHTIITAELPQHRHNVTVTDPGHTHTFASTSTLLGVFNGGVGTPGGGVAYGNTSIASATTGITANTSYSGTTPATVTITSASPAVITWTANGLALNQQVVFQTTGTLYTGITAGTTYFVKTILTADTFTISATNGGTVINTSGSQSGVHNAQALNTSTTAFATIQPTMTMNYIIKVTPDTNSSIATGVTDIQGMIGSITCGSGLLCTGNIINIATGIICSTLGAFPVGTGSTSQCSTTALSTAILNGGPLTINPTSGGIGQGLVITQTTSGSPSVEIALNQITVNDATTSTALSSAFTSQNGVSLNAGAGHNTGIYGVGVLNASTTRQINLVGVTGLGTSAFNAGGTNSAASGTSQGAVFGFNSVGKLNSGATNYLNVVSQEADVAVASGASVYYKGGISIVKLISDAVQGTVDCGLCFSDVAGAAVGWKNVILIGNMNGQKPVDTNSVLFATTGAATILTGFDISSYGITGNAWKSTGITIDGLGQIIAANYLSAAAQYIGWNTRATMYSPADGIIKLTNFSNNDFTRLQFGGTTSSFPSFARSATEINARLADDSTYAPFGASSLRAYGSSTGVTADSLLMVMANTAATVAPTAGTNAHIVGADAALNIATLDAFGQQNQVQGRRAQGTLASKTVVVVDNTLLTGVGAGWDGSTYSGGAQFILASGETWSGIAHGAYIAFKVTPLTTTTIAEAGRFNPSGGLSVGTTTDLGIGTMLANGAIKSLSATASTSKITGSGIFGGGIGVAGATFTDTLNIISVANASTTAALCWNSGTGLVTENGAVGTCTVSDGRLKNIEAPITNSLDKLLKIKGVYFYWKDQSKFGIGRQAGLIAQDVQKVFPELVSTDSEGKLSADYQRLVAPIIEALRELKANNDNLRSEIKKLKRKFK